MATVAHHIHSHYKPTERRPDETLHDGSVEIERLWATERLEQERRARAPPRFVPASAGPAALDTPIAPTEDDNKEEVVIWYKTLNRRNAPTSGPPPSAASTSTLAPAPAPTASPALHPSAPIRTSSTSNWFARPTASRPTPAPSLAAMLARSPPRSAAPLQPPVFLALGPENVGHRMLARRGWAEGEALGQHSRRRLPARTELELQIPLADDIAEIRRAPIIDLTASDDEEPEADEDDPHIALLTPLAPVLKADRLGIGLRAKTEGPYRASKRRITHGQAALAAHVRAGEALRREKALHGRGRCAFSRQDKRAQVERQDVMQYLKS